MRWPWQVVHLLACQNQSGHPRKATIHSKLHWMTNWCQQSFIFFEHTASIIASYLKGYQTDKPVVPFMYYDLKDIVYQLLEINVKPAVLDSFKAKSQTWKDIDLTIKVTIWSVLKSWILCLPLMKISVILGKTIQQMPMKRSQNLGVKRNVLLLSWYPNCLKEALLDQHCWSQPVCLILMFCRAAPEIN